MKDLLWGFCLKRLKRWTRSGLMQIVKPEFIALKEPIILSVGGYGPVDKDLRELVVAGGGKFITYDINPSHNPDILGDITDISTVLTRANVFPDMIVALEVLEHVVNPSQAVASCHSALPSHGKLILSTPWIIPIHDRPYDFYRFTPAALENFLKDFTKTTIYARGNYLDAIITLLLRGLFSGGSRGKLLMIVGVVITFLRKPPSTYQNLNTVDSCIGYVSISSKKP